VSAALETKGLSKSFGALTVAANIDFSLDTGARHALIGPNGAGKTTFVNMLTGVLAPSAGRIILEGNDITDAGQAARVKRGLGRTFQINQLFKGLSVLENVVMAVAERIGVAGDMFRVAGSRRDVIEEAYALLGRLGIAEDALKPAREVPYGRQRLIEIALALAARPRVLLLDEPAAGVPTVESRELFETIAQLPRDVTILLIEHDMDLVFRFAERISVMVSGALLVEDAPEVIARDSRVRQLYLGEAAHG
jgi:branched-chain amino acid transport system ATP-binding protein